ncbi:hypothetical protein H9L12_12820 [Sphingomonas rhizophila]|uniref:EF-hand domain-containing protein n=1 Tax=Sphingomonas rhizophila TaxID=2071607 RepID=A0A7G9SB27_9SPHN|nr:hypothetical protein [Sphingomonas rhizophila]QNN65052.1 hypothetical protein H9L12_12820 [Sphingomonas rhizophila]
MLTALDAAAEATPITAPLNPKATELVESDPALKAWALDKFDSNHDGWLTMFEAQPAIAAFRDIADADRDQRVTVHEYKAAIGFLQTRYNVR